jgi:hypothetical protein
LTRTPRLGVEKASAGGAHLGVRGRNGLQRWPTVLPNTSCAVTLIDRVVHPCDVIAVEGDSYRKREAEADVNTRKKRRGS